MKHSPTASLLLLTVAATGIAACAPGFGGDRDVQVRPLEKMGSADPSYDANYERAVGAINSRDYATALDYLQLARAKDPQNVRVLNAFGVVYDKLGRFDLSARYYAQASAADPASKIVAQNVAYSKLLQGLQNGQASAFAAAQPQAAPASSAMAAAVSNKPAAEPAVANVVVAHWQPEPEHSIAAEQRPVAVGRFAAPSALPVNPALPSLPVIAADNAPAEPAAANIVVAQWQAVPSPAVSSRPVAVGRFAAPSALPVTRALPSLPGIAADNAPAEPAAANIVVAQWQAVPSPFVSSRPVAVGRFAAPSALPVSPALPSLPVIAADNAPAEPAAANIVVAQWQAVPSPFVSSRPVAVGRFAAPSALPVSPALPSLPMIAADNAPSQPVADNVVIARWQPESLPAVAPLPAPMGRPSVSMAQRAPVSRPMVASLVPARPPAVAQTQPVLPAVPAVAASFPVPAEHRPAHPQTSIRPLSVAGIAKPAAAIAALGSNRVLPGSLQIMDASGRKDGAEPIRRGLSALGWTAHFESTAGGQGKDVSVLTYPLYSAAKAMALVRTLPFPVRLIPSGSRSGSIDLVLGSDFLTWQPANRHMPGVWRKFLTVASLDVPQQEVR